MKQIDQWSPETWKVAKEKSKLFDSIRQRYSVRIFPPEEEEDEMLIEEVYLANRTRHERLTAGAASIYFSTVLERDLDRPRTDQN